MPARRCAAVMPRWRRLPDEWPRGRFDLVVISEAGYYLKPASLQAMFRRARDSLADDGTILVCHWRPLVSDYPLGGKRSTPHSRASPRRRPAPAGRPQRGRFPARRVARTARARVVTSARSDNRVAGGGLPAISPRLPSRLAADCGRSRGPPPRRPRRGLCGGLPFARTTCALRTSGSRTRPPRRPPANS